MAASGSQGVDEQLTIPPAQFIDDVPGYLKGEGE